MNHRAISVTAKPVEELDSVVVRFAGDSGDGMQLAGTQLTGTSALAGNDVATFPDFPAEIRAPKGTLAGVSGFQVQFASRDIYTPGDLVDVLVAMTPPPSCRTCASSEHRARLSLTRTHSMRRASSSPASRRTRSRTAVSRTSRSSAFRSPPSPAKRSRGPAWAESWPRAAGTSSAMGLVYWLYGRDLEPTLGWLRRRFREQPEVRDADVKALHAGWSFGETSESFARSYHVPPAALAPGRYRNITGNQALAFGLIAAAELSGKTLFYASYPITPASDILHEAESAQTLRRAHFPGRGRDRGGDLGDRRRIRRRDGSDRIERPRPRAQDRGDRARGDDGAASARARHSARRTEHRAADQARAVGSAPGHVRAKRRGPAFRCSRRAGRPTASTPSSRRGASATRLMTPVVVLSDAFIANGAEPWRIPDTADLDSIAIAHPRRRRRIRALPALRP